MKQIVCAMQPFDAKQIIYIYDGNKQTIKKIPMSTFCDEIIVIAREQEIDTITFKGHNKFSQGIKDTIKKIEKTKYCANNLNITIK